MARTDFTSVSGEVRLWRRGEVVGGPWKGWGKRKWGWIPQRSKESRALLKIMACNQCKAGPEGEGPVSAWVRARLGADYGQSICKYHH
jgi:hypothetical protein